MGFSWSLFGQTVLGLAPIIVMFVPGGQVIAPFLPILTKGIIDAQATGQPGAAKRAAVVQLVSDAAAAANAAKPDTVTDPALLVTSTGNAIDAILGSVNAVQAAHVALPVGTSPALAPIAAVPAA